MDSTSVTVEGVVKTKVIKIGNSQGIRIPKVLIEQCDLRSDVTLEIREEGLLIRPVPKARQGWAQALKEMAENGDDELLLGDFANDWDETEWDW
ncbi:MAG: AbrB/MazE/SpoVT family DNA-binding domain-containing protein [Cyanobacteria bacterium J06623_4]